LQLSASSSAMLGAVETGGVDGIDGTEIIAGIGQWH
jgi:hypothetical protein